MGQLAMRGPPGLPGGCRPHGCHGSGDGPGWQPEEEALEMRRSGSADSDPRLPGLRCIGSGRKGHCGFCKRKMQMFR